MFSGFSSYLGYNPQGSESVQALLQKPDLTLDELLDDETLLTELKTLNNDLLDFLKKEDNFTKMLNHVVLEPSANEQQLNPQRCFKFPLVCTDVLSAECAPLVRYLLNCNGEVVSEDGDTFDQSSSPVEQKTKTEQENNQDCKYLDYLFNFLDCKELNYTAAGYFSRIVNNMIDKFPNDVLAYFYKKRPEQLERLVNHISSESITELLLNVLNFEGRSLDDPLDETYNVKRIQTIKLLAQKLDAQKNPELSSSAAYILKEILDGVQSIHKGNEVVSGLLETESIEELFRILKTKDSGSVSAVAVVLEGIFKYYLALNKANRSEENKTFDSVKENKTLKSELPIVAVTINNVQVIVGLIGDALEAGTSFGSFRMKLVEFLCVAMEVNNSDINTKIMESGFLKVLLKLVLRFEWHSILHNKAEKLIISILDGKQESLKTHLMENVKILDLLIEAFKDCEVPANTTKKDKKIRKGYLGQLAKISNRILENNDAIIKKHTENNLEWEEFTLVEIYAINSKNARQLGGLNPKIERYGSFEIQNPAVLFSNKPGLNLDFEDQQNDQEGTPEDSKGFKMTTFDSQEDIEPTFAIKKAHIKFSQIGGSKGEVEDEIVEEVMDACPSPPIKMKIGFKFEDVIDESIEEDIETEQNSDDTNKLKIKL